MIHQITWQLPIDSLVETTGNSLAIYFQGILMEQLNPEYADQLHNLAINPYSIHVNKNIKQQRVEIILNALTDHFYEEALEVTKLDEFYFKNINKHVPINGMRIEERKESDFANVFYNSTANAKIKIEIETPMSFKKDGQYVIFPTSRLIIQSLMKKYTQLIENSDELDLEMLELIDKNISITSYKLQTRYYQIHKTRIPAFRGELTFNIRQSTTLNGYIKMLLNFGEYSGVGIKTSMGMGAIKIIEGISYDK